MEEIRQLIAQMATENRDWGYSRIRGALGNLGHDDSRGTIARVLKIELERISSLNNPRLKARDSRVD